MAPLHTDSAGVADAEPAPSPSPDRAPEATTPAGTTGATGDGGRRGSRPPWVVWAATALFGLTTALWTVAVPHYRTPDEAAHLDLVLYLAEGNRYPAYDERFFGEALDLDNQRHLVDSRLEWPRFDAADAPPRHARPDVDDLGGVAPDPDALPPTPGRPDHPYLFNQMPQHPPLFYVAMSTALKVERWLLPGDARPSLDRELGYLRLLNVLLVTPLPLLAWATVTRLTGGADPRAGLVAALLPLGLPQLTHIGGSLNNDNLFLLEGGLLTLLLAGVARGRRTWRTDLAVGVVLGLALLTKAFALMLIPWVVAAYALHLWTTRNRSGSARGLLTAGGVSAAVGTWWWIGNWVREGEPAPTSESLTRAPTGLPEGFVAEPMEYARSFATEMVIRTWAWIGYRSPKFELPTWAVQLLTAAMIVAVVAAVWHAAPGLRSATRAGTGAVVGGVRRWDVALAWLPVLLLVVFVARRAWSLYETTAMPSFIQGRYLFAAMAGPMAVVGIGTARVLGRAAVGVALAVVVAVQVWMLVEVVQGSWSGDGRLGALSGALAWSPWPPALVVGTAVAAAATAAAVAVAGVRDRHGAPGQGKSS